MIRIVLNLKGVISHGSSEKALKSLFVTPERIGKAGETHAVLRLRWADFFEYPGRLLRNVYIPKANGEVTEIDLLYVTK